MRRKLIYIMSVVLLAGGIAGCGAKTETASKPKEEVVAEEKDKTTETEEVTEEVTTEEEKENNADIEKTYTVIDTEGGIAITQYNDFGENEIVEIPNEINGKSVVSIGTIDERCSGFSNDQEIKKIIIPDSVKLIGAESFSVCHNLEMLEIGTGIEEIGEKAFFACNRLEEVKFTEGLKKLGIGAFSACVELKTVSLPESLTEIKDGNFVACADKMVITAPSGSVAEEYAKSYEFTFQAE